MRTTSAVAVSLALMAWVSRSLSSCSRLMRGRAGHSHRGRRLHHPPHPERGDDDDDARHDGEYAQGGNVGEHAHQGMRDEEDAEDDLGQPQERDAPRERLLKASHEVDDPRHEGGESEEVEAEGDGDEGAGDGMDHDDDAGYDAEDAAHHAPGAS